MGVERLPKFNARKWENKGGAGISINPKASELGDQRFELGERRSLEIEAWTLIIIKNCCHP